MISKQNPKNLECSDIEHLAQQYLDNVLDLSTRKAFEEHIEYCLPCDKKIEFEVKLRQLVKNRLQNILDSDQIKKTMDMFLIKLNS
jgi:AAA+ superfamily predicted ATPase